MRSRRHFAVYNRPYPAVPLSLHCIMHFVSLRAGYVSSRLQTSGKPIRLPLQAVQHCRVGCDVSRTLNYGIRSTLGRGTGGSKGSRRMFRLHAGLKSGWLIDRAGSFPTIYELLQHSTEGAACPDATEGWKGYEQERMTETVDLLL